MTNCSTSPCGIFSSCLLTTPADIPSDGNGLADITRPYWGVIKVLHVIFTGYDIMSDLNIFLLLKTMARLLLDLAHPLLVTVGKRF